VKRDRILFLARRYPPSLGGIQTFSYKLCEHARETREVRLHALTKDHIGHLGWFVPTAYLTSLIELAHDIDLVYFSDGVIASLAPYLRPFTSVPFATTIHGLELTYSGGLFSRLIHKGVQACDCVCVVSETTGELTEKSGVDANRIRVIYNGIEPSVFEAADLERAKGGLERQLGLTFGQNRVLLNLGRQIPRKGIADFLEKGFDLLDGDIHLVICGDGPDHARILEAAKRHQDRVHVLGHVEDLTSSALRHFSDLFLMPNVRYPNDLEGFGIAPLEAMYDGLPVVAFAVDALVESCRQGGYLVEPSNYQAYADQIHAYLNSPEDNRSSLRQEARNYIRREYPWSKTCNRYLETWDCLRAER
jgi:glycosyltransferase involved in cell wall biosynthesis